MAEGMDHDQDVARLFSWLKAPVVHYREFAPQAEVAQAVATWPVVHKAAVQTGATDDAGPGPQGDSAARERLARERMTLPGVAAAQGEQALQQAAPAEAAAPTPGRLADRPAEA